MPDFYIVYKEVEYRIIFGYSYRYGDYPTVQVWICHLSQGFLLYESDRWKYVKEYEFSGDVDQELVDLMGEYIFVYHESVPMPKPFWKK